jgi:hypothetical protein
MAECSSQGWIIKDLSWGNFFAFNPSTSESITGTQIQIDEFITNSAGGGVAAIKKDINGASTGLSVSGGTEAACDFLVISPNDPVNADGRPNGTIWIKTI